METAKRCAINILRQTPVNGRFTLIAFDDQVRFCSLRSAKTHRPPRSRRWLTQR